MLARAGSEMVALRNDINFSHTRETGYVQKFVF